MAATKKYRLKNRFLIHIYRDGRRRVVRFSEPRAIYVFLRLHSYRYVLDRPPYWYKESPNTVSRQAFARTYVDYVIVSDRKANTFLPGLARMTWFKKEGKSLHRKTLKELS